MSSVPTGTTSSFAILASTAVTNSGNSIINGHVGVSPNTAISGFPPGVVVLPYTIYLDTPEAIQAQSDAGILYLYLAAQPVTATVPVELGGTTLGPGVYDSIGGGALQITGDLTLDAGGDPNAIFIFKSGSTLTTSEGSQIILASGTRPCNIYFQVGSSATLGDSNSSFIGTIVALTSITTGVNSVVQGSLLALNGAVTMPGLTLITTAEIGCVNSQPLIITATGVSSSVITCDDDVLLSATQFPGNNSIGTVVFHLNSETGPVLCEATNTINLPTLECLITAPLDAGSYNVVGVFTDLDANTSTAIAPLVVVPGVNCNGGALPLIVTAIGVTPGLITCSDDVILTASQFPGGSSIGTLVFRLNSGTGPILCQTTSTTNQPSLSCQITAPLLSGTYTVIAVFTDLASNTTTGTTSLVIVPGVECIGVGLPLIVSAVGVTSTTVTCTDEVLLTASRFPAGGSIGTLVFRLNDALGAVLCQVESSTAQASLSCTITAPLQPGTYNIVASFTGVNTATAIGSTSLIVVPGIACSGGDPHIVCLDGSRLDVYEAGFYRLFDNLQEKSQTPVVINAEIVRNAKTHEDSYRKVWISLVDKEYTLEYLPKGVKCLSRYAGRFSSMIFNHGISEKWRETYKAVSGEEYTFICELAQNTVALKTGRIGEVMKYNGLFAGRIVKVKKLMDRSEYGEGVRALFPYSHSHNALLCGSAQPHVITVQGKSLKVKSGVFRVLQTEKLVLNVRLDVDGLMTEAYLRDDDGVVVKWQWIGFNHWDRVCYQNEKVMGVNDVFEQIVDGVMVRVQANGSVSCALEMGVKVRGLMVGEVLEVKEIDNIERMIEGGEEMSYERKGVSGGGGREMSLYEMMVEPL